MEPKHDPITGKIAMLNDGCRKAMGLFGPVYQTAGVAALDECDQSAIREKVETFDSFTEDNDPHGERDFGAFEHNGQKIFWKSDYYAKNDFSRGSEHPERASETTRVLTIMLAEEY